MYKQKTVCNEDKQLRKKKQPLCRTKLKADQHYQSLKYQWKGNEIEQNKSTLNFLQSCI